MEGEAIPCGFCQGSGNDPFGIMSPLSNCQVCGGKGTVILREPLIACAFCRGSGVHRDQRLTCTACGGKGMAHVEQPAERCPRSEGTESDKPNIDHLPCILCGGKGMTTIRRREGQPV